MVTSIPFLIARIPDDNDFIGLREMVHVHEDWTLDYDKGNLKIWSKVVPDATVKMIKVWSVFATVNSVDLFNTLMDPLYRKEWDPHLIVACDIGHLNPNNGVSYYAVSCPPLKSRDFVLQTSWLDRGSEHYILNHSVCHKDYPPRRGFIRAISYFTGYFIKCIPFQGTEMYFVTQTDPQGIIPAWVVNKCTQIFAPRFVKQLEKAAFGYTNWKSENNPHLIPWIHPDQLTSPKICISDCVPSEEEIESPFFQYLLQKSAKMTVPTTSSQNLKIPSTSIDSGSPSKLANPTTCSPPIVNKSIGAPTAMVEMTTTVTETEKESKSKKSKKLSWVNLGKNCFGRPSKS